jgi:HD-GYP domain-containing protein (c-di-GMP phosphodiesterase class II)
LYLAGIVHDLGKIQIPSEILTKPSRLSSEEFNLVKLHPEVGYNILKPIDFPWPIAVIVRQHHEYLNGSGYPLGLTAEKIILESKILTVADIVESMSADRPYRPALGIDSAIQEIEKLSGVKLDESVVKACVSVLRRGEFVPVQIALQF